MRLFYGGAEAPTLRRRLASSNAARFSVSYWHLRDRLPKSGEFPFAERFPEGAEILLDSGGYTANNRREEHDDDYWVDYLDGYIELVGQNFPALTMFTEFDFLEYSVDDLWALRYDVWSKLPDDKFLPVWHPEHGFDELTNLARTYAQVAIPGEALKEIAHRLPRVANQYGVRFHGLAVNSEELIKTAGLSSVSSTAWTAPQRHGDRVIWERGKLHRYPKAYAEKGIETHRELLQREGFDLDALVENDPEEVTRLTIWSLESWSAHLTRGGFSPDTSDGSTPSEEARDDLTPDPSPNSPDTSGSESGTVLVPREPEDRKILPVIGLQQRVHKDEHGDEVRSPDEMHTKVNSARVCNTCYIKDMCPEFKPNSECAFDLPVEIKTKDQLSAMLTGMLEIQTRRALFARYAEELEGGYPTEKVSGELDRLMAMTHRVKEIQDNRDFMEIHVKARGESGVLTRIFGEQAGQQARELERPISPEQTDEILAEVIEED